MGLNLNDKKLILATALGTLAFCAFFLAQGTTSLIAAAVFPLNTEVVSVASVKSGSTAVAPGSTIPDVKVILARNIFDSTTGPLWPPPADDFDLAPEPEEEFFLPDPKNPPPQCEGTSIRLVASIYSESAPQWSFASLTTGSDSPLLYRIDSEIEGHKIVAIYPKAVYMKPASGKACSLLMFGTEVSATSRADDTKRIGSTEGERRSPESDRRMSSSGGLSESEMDENITRVSDTKFTIQRSLIDKVLANQAALMRSARIVPHERDGQVEGVKLYGIRRNSLLGKLGLQNGDLLRSINGFDMTSPDSALEAYSRLRSADNLTVSIQRRRQDMNIAYGIQ
ncbi:MAG: general secretion pathway protein GspC [Deltaproteobacteria bacterium]|nr:general secretion pathway protein GspC [Deltaproteobacteria bacterium]